jgi:predicted aspartyl protease
MFDVVNVVVPIQGVPTPMLLDTGSAATLVWSRARALEANAEGHGGMTHSVSTVSGKFAGRVTHPVELAVGGAVLTVPVLVLDERMGCNGSEGVLGMDVLGNCAFVWRDDEVWLGCASAAEKKVSAASR